MLKQQKKEQLKEQKKVEKKERKKAERREKLSLLKSNGIERRAAAINKTPGNKRVVSSKNPNAS